MKNWDGDDNMIMYGYVLKTLNQLGATEKQKHEVIIALKEECDFTAEEEAKDYYLKY